MAGKKRTDGFELDENYVKPDTLDRSRPFGLVCGSSRACFEQDGKLYNAEGELVRGE